MAATIVVVCPHCKHKTRASAQHAGRRGKCPKCQKLIDINPSGQDSAQTMAPTDSGAPARGMVASGIQNSALLAVVISVAVTVILYSLVFFPLRAFPVDTAGRYVSDLMTKRGVVQYQLVLVTSWGLALLALRYLAVKRELRTTDMELQLIPLEIGMQITPNNVDQFLGHIGKLPPAQQNSILARRLRGALEHFKHRNNVSEVQTYLSSQAQLDNSAVDSGYTLLRVFIWLCPILGFIGTVSGISEAVTGLRKALPNVEASAPAEPEIADVKGKDDESLTKKMLSGMDSVTAGLATAFDTTLLGLLCVCLLMFPYESLKKIEYAVLDRVEDFTNESLVRRLAEDEGGADKDDMPQLVRATLESAFREHQRWLGDWQAQVRQLGQLIGADFESAATRVVEQVAQSEGARIKEIQHAAKAVDDLFQKVTASGPSAEVLEALQKLSRAMVAHNSMMGELVSQQKHLDSYKTIDPSGDLDRSALDGGALEHGTLDREALDQLEVPESELPRPAVKRKSIFGRLFGG